MKPLLVPCISLRRVFAGPSGGSVAAFFRMSSFMSPPGPGTEDKSFSYEEAVKTLNTLQSNAATLQKLRKERPKNDHQKLPQTRLYLERSGMSLADLDSLNTIHVSGTKGKGSTCAFCESILRQHGLKTGFYSSPHLVSVTERIRINGAPISREKFKNYFWMVYNKVCKGREAEDRPHYFQFLTILAFNIFYRENVDVAVVEVGIGGEFDNTNIIRKPVVTGITALGLDHTSLLGDRITDIAWHKAGIMKPGVPAIIDGEQAPEALEVVERRAQELQASSLVKVPDLRDYDWGRYPVLLGLYGRVQERNASLALALSRQFLAARGHEAVTAAGCSPDPARDHLPTMDPFKISAESALGLRLTDWPGRSQLISHGRVDYFLDGAHTDESIRACRAWFSHASKEAIKKPSDKVFKVMLFNTTGDRDPRALLQPFINSDLDLVVFSTNNAGLGGNVDQENFTTTDKIQLSRCEHHLRVWTKMQSSSSSLLNSNNLTHQGIPGVVLPTILESLQWITQGSDPLLEQAITDIRTYIHGVNLLSLFQELEAADQVQVLITGSLHLVGGALACIEPDGLPERRVDPELVARYHDAGQPRHPDAKGTLESKKREKSAKTA